MRVASIKRRKIIRVTSIQFEVSRTKRNNLKRMEEMLNTTHGSDLIVLPELWNIGYCSFDSYHIASEPLKGETFQMISRKARDLNAYILAGSIVEKSGSKFYNTSLLIDPCGLLVGYYRKIHLFSYNSLENKLLNRGRDTVAVKTKFGLLGLATCYDLRFPELFKNLFLNKKVEVFLVPSAWPYSRLEHWRILNRSRSIENQSFLISSNCTGMMNGVKFAGHSMIIDPLGNILAEGGTKECIIRANIDLNMIKKIRSEILIMKESHLCKSI